MIVFLLDIENKNILIGSGFKLCHIHGLNNYQLIQRSFAIKVQLLGEDGSEDQ